MWLDSDVFHRIEFVQSQIYCTSTEAEHHCLLRRWNTVNAPLTATASSLLRSAQSLQLSDVDISLLPLGSVSKPWTAWAQAPLVTPLSWRRSPYPHSHPAWSAPPSATRPSGSSGVTAQPRPPPQTPSSISCRWGTRAAGRWPISQARGSDLIREESGVWGRALDNCIEEGTENNVPDRVPFYKEKGTDDVL